MTQKPQTNIINWDGKPAILLTGWGYEALVIPSLGANVLSLKYKNDAGEEFDILHTPANAAIVKNDPYAWGMPVLFPANRVSGASYEWDGVQYRFMANYPNGVHIHGVLHYKDWPLAMHWTDDSGAWARFDADTDTDEVMHGHFPVDALFRLEIGVTEKGLVHRFTVKNRGCSEIPVGLAYHTALRIPFCAGSAQEDVKISVPLMARCTDDPVDRLPNGETKQLSPHEAAIATAAGADPMAEALDYLYTARPGEPEAIVRDTRCGWEAVYTAGPENHYWILWNRNADEGFISIEPQTWLTDAMQKSDPAAYGAAFVGQNVEWVSENILSVRKTIE